MSVPLSLPLRWLNASALATLAHFLNERAPESDRWLDPWHFLALFSAALAQAAFAMAWLPRERLPWRRMPVRLGVLLVASVVETAVLVLALLAWVGLAVVGSFLGGLVGMFVFLWLFARLLPLGPLVLLSEHGPLASVGAAWARSRGTALVGGLVLAIVIGLLALLETVVPTGSPLLGVFVLMLLGGLSAWAYRTGPVVGGDGMPLQPDGNGLGIEGITPSLPEVEWERAPP